MNNRYYRSIFTFVLLLLTSGISVAQDSGSALRELLANPDASHFSKVLACKKAALTNDVGAIPVLGDYLLDDSLSHPVRIALQQIGDSSAGQALRDVLPNAKGAIQIGIIGTIGERREPESVIALAPYLNSDSAVVYATAVSLGKIGTDEACVVLRHTFETASDDQRVKLLDGLYNCGEKLRNEKRYPEAIALYLQVAYCETISSVSRSGAVRGLLLTENATGIGVEHFRSYLQNVDDVFFLATLEASCEIAETAYTQVMMEIFGSALPDRQILLLDALQQRADTNSRELILQIAGDMPIGGISVQTAAIKALLTVPNESVIALVFEQLRDTNPAIVDAAIIAMSEMNYPGLNEQIIVQLEREGEGSQVIPLARVCQLRRITDSTPQLLKNLSNSNEAIRNSVVTALGYTVSGEDVGVLVDRLIHATSDLEFETVKKALHVVCTRTVDKDQVAQKIATPYDSVSVPTQCTILELLGAIGGPVAIATVDKAVDDPTDAIQDTATRVLGDWPDPDAASVLLGVIKRPEGNPKYQTRALRGYIRIFRQMDTSDEHRFNMSMEAMAIAKRDEEKLLIIDALGRFPIPQAINKLNELLSEGNYKEEICQSLVNACAPMAIHHRDLVARSMERVIETTTNADLIRLAGEVKQQASE